jgi:hypothetical protein
LLRIALAEHVVVDTVQHQDFHDDLLPLYLTVGCHDLSSPRGRDDGLGDAQVLQTVARTDQRLRLAADDRAEVFDLFQRSSRTMPATPTSNGFHHDRSSALGQALSRMVGIDSAPEVPAMT